MPRPPRPRRVTVVRWTLDGQRVPAGTPGAQKEVTRSETWYAKIDGRKVSLGTTDEGEAWAELKRLLRDRQDRRAGILTSAAEAARRGILDHLDDWLRAVVDGGAAPERGDILRRHVGLVIATARWQHLGQIDAPSCLAAVAKITRDRNLAPQTRNEYLRQVQQFVRWCCLPPARMSQNPLAGLKPLPVETDRRRIRRCPTDEEIARLFAYLESGAAAVRNRQSGPQRALGYRVAMAAGLRASELRSLTRASFDLSAATVTVRAERDKKRRYRVLPLPSWLVEQLREWFAADGGLWTSTSPAPSRRGLAADLEACGVLYCVQTEEGPEFLDLHALRVWYVTQLANQPGISPKVLMELARHRNANLTLRTYSRAKQGDLRAAVEGLPQPGRMQP